ncbi:MAG: sensor histidine kinase [Egibacteraceae bacterium]
MRTHGPPLPVLGVPATDVAVAVAIGAVTVFVSALAALAQSDGRPLWPWGYALIAGATVALAFRCRWPVAVMAVAAVCVGLHYGLSFPDGPELFPFGVALYTVSAAGRRVAAILGAVAVLVVVETSELVLARPPESLELIAHAAVITLFVVLGEVTRTRHAYLAEVEERAAEAERTREEVARRRATEERLRIARELHDVLAHQISLISVQAGAALHRRDVDQAFSALAAIKDASRATLRELRSVLGVLRQVDQDDDPQPTLARLDELVARTRTAGLSVSVAVAGTARTLPAAVDLAAYRIVQEALTNAVRHAGATTATVGLSYDGDVLEVKVDDNGCGVVEPAGGPDGGGEGYGVRGMRERAMEVGGNLSARPLVEGGFRVFARFPLVDSV